MNLRKVLISSVLCLFVIYGYGQIDFGTNIRVLTNLPIDTRMVMQDTVARDSIKSMYRYEGLTVYVKSVATNFQLRGGITNSHWVALNGNNTAYSWGNHALYGYITASSSETLTNKSGNISMWTNDAGYLTNYNETDPVWSASASNYFTKSNLQTSGSSQVHFNNISNKPSTLSGYGITDAMASSHPANSINAANISSWNTAYSWGNHALAGYLTASSTNTLTNKSGNISMWTNDAGYLTNANETDPVWSSASVNYYSKTNMQTSGAAQLHFNNITSKPVTLAGYGITDAMTTSHPANAITSTNISNWNTAFGWGNHASAGYFKNSNDLFWDNTNKRLGIGTSAPSASLSVGNTNQFQVNSTGNIVKLNNIITNFPALQGSANTILTNDGSGNLSWSSTLPGGTKTKTTAEGGFAVYMYNGSGKGISKYMVVMADPDHDTSIAIAPAGCVLPIGITNDSIPSGSWGWIVVSGITYVQIYTSVTRSYYAFVSSSADGKVESDNKKGNNHAYRIVGNFLESKTVTYSKQGTPGSQCTTGGSNSAVAKIIVHFN